MGAMLMQADASRKDTVMDVTLDESALILLQHCRDMKQQETRLRIITLLLLLTCSALVLLGTCTDLKERLHQGSNNAAVDNRAYSRQECQLPAETSQTEASKMHIDLTSLNDNCPKDLSFIAWDPVIGSSYDKQDFSIVIPANGPYFVYMTFELRCFDNKAEGFKYFRAILKSFNEAYKQMGNMTDVHGAIQCPSERAHSMYMGRLFDLQQGDHLSVQVTLGYKQLLRASFGAFQV